MNAGGIQEVLTLGHGAATADELSALIREAGIARIVDVRKIPGSARHPQFRREEMARWLPQSAGSAYVWEPDLGGFRKGSAASANVALRNTSFRAYTDYMETEAFARALAGVLEAAARERLAVLCSETLWWRCHRRLIADCAMLAHGATVRHLMHDGALRPHVPTAGVRLTESGVLRYDVLETSE